VNGGYPLRFSEELSSFSSEAITSRRPSLSVLLQSPSQMGALADSVDALAFSPGPGFKGPDFLRNETHMGRVPSVGGFPSMLKIWLPSASHPRARIRRLLFSGARAYGCGRSGHPSSTPPGRFRGGDAGPHGPSPLTGR